MIGNWNDYESYTLDELVALQKKLSAIPEDERCDNFAPGTCCDSCNYYIIVEELTKRLLAPITT